MSDDNPILPGLSPVCGLDVHARFDGSAITSNGGALLLREAGRGLDLAKVIHSYTSMIDARIGRLRADMRTVMTLMCCVTIRR